MSRALSILFYSMTVCAATAQVSIPDSVQGAMATTTKDSLYVSKLNELAFGYLRSNPSLAREIAISSMNTAQEIHCRSGYSRALNLIGSSFWVTGSYESALDYYHLSARESKLVSDSVGVAGAYHNIGEVFKKLGDYDKGIEFLNTSLQWNKKNDVNLDITLYNLGEAYYFKGDYSVASSYFDQALSRALQESDNRTIAYAYTGLGLIKHKNKDYYQALAYYTKAEKLWEEEGEIRSLIQAYQDFTETFIELKLNKKAQEYISKAIRLSEQIDAPDLQVNNFMIQSRLYEAGGLFEQALVSLHQHNTLKDSLYNEKRSEQIARSQAVFETEARTIENQQLKATQSVQDAQIRMQKIMLVGISTGLIAVALFALILFRQRRLLHDKTGEIQQQKEEIERKSLELRSLNSQLQDLNKYLESKIASRTMQLTRQNQKMAAYAHANAHQLRAPVVSILGLLHLIERIQLPEEDKILVSQLQVCGQNLDRITREISRNLEEEEKQLDDNHV